MFVVTVFFLVCPTRAIVATSVSRVSTRVHARRDTIHDNGFLQTATKILNIHYIVIMGIHGLLLDTLRFGSFSRGDNDEGLCSRSRDCQ